jgi:hypothetical protein
MPVFVQESLRWIRHHPLAAGLCGLLLGVVMYWQLQPVTPPTPQPATASKPFRGVVPPTASLEKAMAVLQRENAQLRLTLDQQRQALTALERDQKHREAQRQQVLKDQERRVEAALQQALAAANTPPSIPPSAAFVPPETPKPILRVLRPAKPPTSPESPPAPSPQWVRLRSGSFTNGRLLTGVFATARRQGALPVSFVLETPFTGPDHAAPPLSNCLAIGKAEADLTSQRVLVQLIQLSCLLPDSTTFEQAITGYATGEDADFGIPGERVLRTGAFLSNVALASLVAAGEAYARTQSNSSDTVITQVGGTALQLSTQRLVDFFLDRAEEQIPAIWVRSGSVVRLVLQEGITVEGLPVTAAAPRRPTGFD